MCDTFATSVASNLVSKLGEYLIAPIGRQFGYVLCYNSDVEDLKKEVNDLKNARERVQSSVDDARYNVKPIFTDVQNWLKNVDKEADNAEKLLRVGENAKIACFHGWLPNPVVRHPIGRKVKKMTQVIQELHKKNNFPVVHAEDPPIGIATPATAAATIYLDNNEDFLESRSSFTENVIKAIADDNVSVAGVYGPGGVGKSKLLGDIERLVKKEKLFDVVAMADVSRNPDLRRIQGEIACALGLKTMNNEETTRGRANLLRKRLEFDSKKKILIILDNLWTKLELHDVGIPCGYDNKVKGCKLLLSSRNREVLCVDMGSDREFLLNQLEDGEARRLFERTLGDRVNDLCIKPWTDEVVKKCGGLPLLIVSLAKRLKRGDLVAWRNASTHIDMSDLRPLVELNYNDLKDERIRKLFLVCALDPRGIDINYCLAYSMGLGLYKEFSMTIEDARDRLIMDLQKLQDSSLLLDSDDMEDIKMHDIFVDVAISITSPDWKALVGKHNSGFTEWSKDELLECTAISVIFVGIDELPEKLDCPNLRMLLLFENNPSLRIPELFFESMKKLQTLDFTGLSFTTLPSSIVFLENLNSLCLDYCDLEDLTLLGKLKGLQFLSFYGSAITRLPEELGGLTKLRFLDLRECTKLKVIEPGMLGSLVNMEELHIVDSFDGWDAEDESTRSNASLTELKNMKNLSTLSIAIPHFVNLSTELPFGKLKGYKIQIGEGWEWEGNEESRTLKLKLDSGNLLSEEWVQNCLQRTQGLHLDGLRDGEDNIHDFCADGFQELKHLHVQNSPSLRFVVHSKGNVPCVAFMTLECLLLENLENLEKICGGCLALESFNKLKIVKIENCGEIKHLFPSSMTRILLQLEEIEIRGCRLMQQIVADAKVDEDGDEMDDDPKIKLCNLRRLTLQDLPKMTSFCETANHSVDFFDGQQLTELQSLEAVTIERCQLIQEIFGLEGLIANGEVKILMRLEELILRDLPSLECIWNKNPQRTLCFPNLTVLKVQNCENLRFLFSSSMAKALGQIKEIEIVSCKLIEKIIDVQEEELEEKSDALEFPQLFSLSLEELPNLWTFSYGKYLIRCPSLIRLKISRCAKLMTFSSFDGRQQSITTNRGGQQAFGSFNSDLSLPGFFNDMVLFPSLEELKLSYMSQIKRIWHNQLPGQSSCRLASLTVEFCENLTHVFPANSIDGLQSLNNIEVAGCPSLEALFELVSISSEKRQKLLVLSALEKMKLFNLPRLRDILKSDCKVTLAFPSLTEVNVRLCHSLSYLFSSAMAKNLTKLAVLDVSCCNNLWGIIATEEGKRKTVETFKFNHLSTLKLDDLNNLNSFHSTRLAGDGLHPLFDKKLAFPKLEALHINGIQQEEIWNDKVLVESFCRLKVLKVKQCRNLMNVIPSFMWKSKMLLHGLESLTVEECPCLRHLFTMSTAKGLGQLQYLKLGGCGEMEYIFSGEEERTEEGCGRIVIPELVTLYIHNMPKLRSCCRGKHILEWPSLKEFTIEDCKALEVIFGDASCTKPEGNGQTLLLAEKQVEFPNLKSMKISRMANMEMIWVDEYALNAFSKLKTLIVEYCEKLSCIFPSDAILVKFRNLEKLSLTDCDSLEVVFRVQELNETVACSPSRFQLKEINLERLPKVKHVWSGHPRGTLAFECLRCLKAVDCASFKSIFPSSVAKSSTRLEELIVKDCGVEEIIAEEDGGAEIREGDHFFPRLTKLHLVRLSKLRSFYRDSHTSTWPLLTNLVVAACGDIDTMRLLSFSGEIQSCQGCSTSESQRALFFAEKVIPRLETLALSTEDVAMMQHYTFHDLKHLELAFYDKNEAFPSNFLLHRFPNLEALHMVSSPFEEIFPEDHSGQGGASLKALGNLKKLSLVTLDNLRRVWKDGSLMVVLLRQIEVLLLCHCPSLSIILPSAISFQRLTHLKLKECTGLVHMGTCSAVTSLAHLTELILQNCGKMEDVVTDDGNGVEDISFPKLRQLQLDGLSCLQSFSLTNCAFRFPSLVNVIVKECPKMSIFCMGTLTTPRLDKVFLSLEDDEWRWEDDLNTTIQTLSTLNDAP